MAEDKQLNSNLKFIANSSILIFATIILSKIFTYIYRIIIARHFGPETYGLFSLATMLSGWIIVLANLGITEGLSRYIPFYRGKKETKKISFLVRATINLLLVSGIAGGLILFLLSGKISVEIFKDPKLIPFLQLFSLSIPINIFLSFFLGIIKSYEKIAVNAFISNIVEPLFGVILIFILIFLGVGVSAVPISSVLSTLITMLVALFICKWKFPGLFKKHKVDKKTRNAAAKSLFKYSLPLIFAGIIWRVFYWADSFFIGYFRNTSDVGVYNAAVPLASLLSMATLLFVNLFFPLITKEYASGKTQTINELSKQVGKWVLFINIPLFTVLFIFPDRVINLFFGSDYLIASNSLRILAVGALFLAVSEIPSKTITMAGKSKLILFDILGAFVLNIIANLILIPKYGISGAAVATSLSLIAMSLTYFLQSSRILGVFPIRRKVINLVIASLVSLIPILYLSRFIGNSGVLFVGICLLFGAMYVGLVFLFKGFDKKDFIIIHSLLKKVRK